LAKIPGAAKEVNGNPANLAALLADLDSVTDEQVRQALRNNGGGYLNHFQFFATLTPPDSSRETSGPEGDIALAIAERFGGFDAFREEFTKKSLGLFGSGFVYLVKEMKNSGSLAIKEYRNQDSPVMDGDVPIVGIDLWEHAYVVVLFISVLRCPCLGSSPLAFFFLF
jgi:superoxide dismutase, Fe-Mn family